MVVTAIFTTEKIIKRFQRNFYVFTIATMHLCNNSDFVNMAHKEYSVSVFVFFCEAFNILYCFNFNADISTMM